MNKIIILFLSVVPISILGAYPDNQAACREKVEAAINALNEEYFRHGLKVIDLHDLHFEQSPNVTFQGNAWCVRIGSSVVVDCLPVSGKPHMIVRSDLVDNGKLYNIKPIPTWTPEKAVDNSKVWVQAFLGYFPKDVGRPKVTFNFDEYDSKQYYGIIWNVSWPRIDSDGHLFEADSLDVTVSEDYGLTGCALHFESAYKISAGKISSRADALSASRAPAEKLLAKCNFGPNVNLGAAKSELLVSNPNDIFSTTSGMLKADLNARLAWRIEYQLTDGKAASLRHSIVVRIDAHTKEVLGGNLN